MADGPASCRSGQHDKVQVSRLKRRHDFLTAREHGASWVCQHLIIQWRPSDAADKPADGIVRLGLTATKKLGGAVIRNRARRRLRSAFAFERPAITLSGDVVLIARSGVDSCPFLALRKELRWGLKKLGLTGVPT